MKLYLLWEIGLIMRKYFQFKGFEALIELYMDRLKFRN